MNMRTLIAASVTLAGLATASSAQDGTFNAWLDAPETVNAGETVTVTAWVTFESDTINLDESFFGVIQTSIEATSGGSFINSFSSAYGEFVIPRYDGTPDDNGIRDIWALQMGYWGFNQTIDQNPIIAAFSFDVTTNSNTFGEFQLDFVETTLNPDSPILAWYLDFENPNNVVISNMPNIEALFEPVLIRVVPGAGTGALLALAGLGTLRRRR